MNHNDTYQPSTQAVSILTYFLDPRRIEISARELAELTGSTESSVREALAPAVGHGVLSRRRDDLTGELGYLTGLKFRTVSHLLQPPAPPAALAQPEVTAVAAASPASAFQLDGKVGDDGIYYRRGDQFLGARDQGREITAPPSEIKALADSARRWVKRYAPGYQVRALKQLSDRAEGAIYIVKRSTESLTCAA